MVEKNALVVVVVVAIILPCLALQRPYQVPEELEIILMGASGRYRRFQRIDCIQPPELKSTCNKGRLFERWHWNHATKTCELVFIYECEPTRNNFYSMTQCYKVAGTFCGKITEDLYQYYYHYG